MLPLTPDSIRITQNGRSLNKKYLNNYDCISSGAPNYARFFTNIAYNFGLLSYWQAPSPRELMLKCSLGVEYSLRRKCL